MTKMGKGEAAPASITIEDLHEALRDVIELLDAAILIAEHTNKTPINMQYIARQRAIQTIPMVCALAAIHGARNG